MCMIDYIKLFMYGGIRTFRSASKGDYHTESEEVSVIRKELFSQPTGRYADAVNMHNDLLMVGRDARTCFNKIKMANG